MKRRLCFLLAVFGMAVSSYGQSTRTLTLEEGITLAVSASPAAEIAQLRFTQSRLTFRSFRAQYLPALSLTGNIPGLSRSISEIQQDDGSVLFVEENRTSSSANLQVSQPIPLTGGQVSVTSRLGRLNNQFGDSDFTQWQSSPLVIQLTQPLLRFNEMKWSRRTEPLRYEVAERAYAEELETIAVDVTNRFFDVYLAQMNREIAAYNVAVNDTIYQLSEGRYNIGRIAENDLLQSELALLNAQSALSDADIAYQEALQNLKLALDLPYDQVLDIVPPVAIPSLRIDPDFAVDQVRRNRADILNLELVALEARQEVARARRSRGFSADLTAVFGLNQSAETFGSAYESLLNQQRFSVGLEVPLHQWGRGRAQVAAAVAAQEQVEKDAELQRKTLEQEAYFVALQVQQLTQQVAIAAKADTVATRSFEVARQIYTIGNIPITDLFNAQRAKDEAQRSYIQVLRQFWTSYFNLRRLTLYDFIRDQPVAPPIR